MVPVSLTSFEVFHRTEIDAVQLNLLFRFSFPALL